MTTKVLRIIARMNVGGPAVQVTTLVGGLQPPAYDHRLLTGVVDEGEGDFLELRAPHVPRRIIPGLGRAPRWTDDLRALVAIVREVRRFRPDVVHTHTAKAGVLGRAAAITCRVPVRVHTFHGHLLHGYFGPRTTKLVILVERLLARRTTALVAVGDQVRRDLLAAGIGRPDQYTVVPPGLTIPDPPARQEARDRIGLDPDEPVVAFVGRLTSVKRPDRFVEVARLVLAQRPRATFLVVGEGELLDEMRAQAADLGERVRFLGWRDDVEVIYAAADVALLTSDNEGMPVSLIEASMAGCPGVTTGVGSAAEVILDGVTGFVRPTDPAALAAATLELLDDPERRARFGDAAAEHARRAFGAERLVGDTTNLYERLLADRRR